MRQGEDARRVTFVFPPAKDASKDILHMGHCSGVNSLCIANTKFKGTQRLWTASRDSLIKAWEIVPHQGNRDSRVELVGEYEGHVDWVNDTVLVNEDLIASCSSDSTIRIWKNFLHEDHHGHMEHASLACFSGHSDYVTKLCCPGKKHSDAQKIGPNSVLYSCGLLGEVFVWDVERSSESQRPVSSLSERDSNLGSSSAYSISCDYNGHLVCVGCSSGKIYAMDTRSGRVEFELLGHVDNVRGLTMSIDGSVLVSGGSDHTMKMWDLKQRRCLHTYAVHTDSIWCLQTVRDDASEVYSAGKDGCVYKTDTSSMTSRLLAREKGPITALGVSPGTGKKHHEGLSIWVGSENASVRCYKEQDSETVPTSIVGSVASVRSRKIFESTGDFHPTPECNQPCLEITGTPSIVEISMLTDKIHLIFKDSEGKIGMWDVTKASKTKDFGTSDFQDTLKELFDPTQSALTWFQPDCSLGVVAGHLQPSSCFTCETYVRQLGFPDAPPDEKVNLAVQMLKILFHRWKLTVTREEREDDTTFEFDKDDQCDTLDSVFRFAEESSPAVMVSGDQYSTPWKKSCSEMDGTEDVPGWVSKCVLADEYPKSKALKMCFVLVPQGGTNLPSMGQSRLTAPRVLQVEKMLDYVIKRLKSKGIDCCKRPIYWGKQQIADEGSSKNRPQVILTCNGVLIPSDFTLAAIRQWMWKKPDDLRIEYSLADSKTPSVLPKIKMPM